MNKIETLIQELCPNGVKYYFLKDVLVKSSGTKITASQMKEIHKDDGVIKIFAGGKTFAMVNPGDIPENDVIDRPSIIVKSRGIIEFEYYTKPFSHKAEFWSYHSENKNVNIKFIYYLLKNSERYFNDKASVMQMPQISSKDTQNFKIPIPPLEIQEEIVKILDKFTDYVTELTTELTLRQKQYHYYRDMLLSFEDEFYQVKWKCLEDLCDVRDGTHDSPIKQNSGKLLITSKNIKNGCVSYKDAYYISQEDFNSINVRSKVDKNDILFTMIGTVGEIAHVTSEPDYAIKNVGLIKTGNKVFARYLFHYLQSSLAKKYIEDNKSKGSQVFLALGKIRKFPIPYIDTKIQSRIVQVLDNFDAVCNDLNIGLPKEIELRQKQYEFFRDKLLTFAAEGVYTDSTVQTRHN